MTGMTFAQYCDQPIVYGHVRMKIVFLFSKMSDLAYCCCCLHQAEPTYDNVFKLQYLDQVVNESLRLHAPAQRFVHQNSTKNTCKLIGFEC